MFAYLQLAPSSAGRGAREAGLGQAQWGLISVSPTTVYGVVRHSLLGGREIGRDSRRGDVADAPASRAQKARVARNCAPPIAHGLPEPWLPHALRPAVLEDFEDRARGQSARGTQRPEPSLAERGAVTRG